MSAADSAARRRQWRDPAYRAKHSAKMREQRKDPAFEQRRKAAAAPTPQFHAAAALTSARRNARYRGGAIPEGYRDLYIALRKTFGAKEALRLVRLQRGADLKRAA